MNTLVNSPVGTVVNNFGAIALVIRTDDQLGYLVREAGPNGQQWYADPALCTPVIDKQPAVIAAWATEALAPHHYANADAFVAAVKALVR